MNVPIQSIQVMQEFIDDHGFDQIEAMQHTLMSASTFIAGQSTNPSGKTVFLPGDAENLLNLYRFLNDTKKSISNSK
jgi:hypothetical protein